MLTLPIKKKWFDMIITGDKKEEYREIKPYWTVRFQNIGLLDWIGRSTSYAREIKLRNGYSPNSREAIALVGLDIRQGFAKWGAVPGETYYVLSIITVYR